MKYQNIPQQLFVKNQNKLFDTMDNGELAILCANINYPRNGDQTYPFRQDSDFFWLTGINQDWTCLFMFKDSNGTPDTVLLTKETNKRIQLWDGPRLDKKQAAEISGISHVEWLDTIEDYLETFLKK